MCTLNMLLSHAAQSCTLVTILTAVHAVHQRLGNLPVAYLNICWRLAGWLAAQDLQPTFQLMFTCEAYHSHAFSATMGTAQGVRAHSCSLNLWHKPENIITGVRCSICSTSKHTGDAVRQTADLCFLSATCLPCTPSSTKRFCIVNRSKCSGLNWPALRQAHEQAGSGCSGPPIRRRLQAGSRPRSAADLPTARHSLCAYPCQSPVFRSDCLQDNLEAWHSSCD